MNIKIAGKDPRYFVLLYSLWIRESISPSI